MCVCVCERERERERDFITSYNKRTLGTLGLRVRIPLETGAGKQDCNEVSLCGFFSVGIS